MWQVNDLSKVYLTHREPQPRRSDEIFPCLATMNGPRDVVTQLVRHRFQWFVYLYLVLESSICWGQKQSVLAKKCSWSVFFLGSVLRWCSPTSTKLYHQMARGSQRVKAFHLKFPTHDVQVSAPPSWQSTSLGTREHSCTKLNTKCTGNLIIVLGDIVPWLFFFKMHNLKVNSQDSVLKVNVLSRDSTECVLDHSDFRRY